MTLEFLENRLVQEDKSKPQAERATHAAPGEVTICSRQQLQARELYTEAIDILRNSKPNKKKKFKYLINEWGADLTK